MKQILPIPLLGIDTDNDGAFMNETVIGHCKSQNIELTRSRAYLKNDQAWIEQKNGSVVRRFTGSDALQASSRAKSLGGFTNSYGYTSTSFSRRSNCARRAGKALE